MLYPIVELQPACLRAFSGRKKESVILILRYENFQLLFRFVSKTVDTETLSAARVSHGFGEILTQD